MANFPVAQITGVRANMLKGEMTVALRVPFNPDTEPDVLKQAASLRRMFEAEAPVSFTVRPMYEQASLFPEDAAPHIEMRSFGALPTAPEPAPEPEPPAAADLDAPAGQTLDDFLSGEDS